MEFTVLEKTIFSIKIDQYGNFHSESENEPLFLIEGPSLKEAVSKALKALDEYNKLFN